LLSSHNHHFFRMKAQSIIITVLLVCGMAQAQDVCHFNKVEIPRNEARLLELARVIEFRCECLLPKLDREHGDFQFIAERYQAGKCVSRQCFSLGKYSSNEIVDGNYQGVISFGWDMNDQKLVGVHDSGYFRYPGFAELPGFHASRPNVWAFFKNSQAEQRTSKSGMKFDLYPVIGIRGEKELMYNGVTISGRTGDIYSYPSKQLTGFFKGNPDAVIVYLCYAAGRPDLDYDKKADTDGVKTVPPVE